MTQQRIVNSLTGAVALLTLAIGAGAFVLSYDALYATGQIYGIPSAKAWIWPLLIDGPLVVFTIALLVSQLARAGIRLWAGLVGLYTIGTIAFNLSHAQPSPLGWLVAVVAPVGLLLTTEALRHLAKTIIDRQAMVESLAELAAILSTRQETLDKLNGQIERAQQRFEDIKAGQIGEISRSVQDLQAAKQAKIEERRASVLSLLGQGMEERDIATELGVNIKTIRRDIKNLNGAAQSARGLTDETL